MMKCHFCTQEPQRACLHCGVFFCAQHGRYTPPKPGQQSMFNSLCQECSIVSVNRFRVMGMVFGFLGISFLISGGSIMAIMGALLPGVIFLGQGILFTLLGLGFYAKYKKDLPQY